MIRPKVEPLRLDSVSYENLRQQILRRDNWRCQSCGTMSNLEVHHREFRSHAGNDSEENLITLSSWRPCKCAWYIAKQLSAPSAHWRKLAFTNTFVNMSPYADKRVSPQSPMRPSAKAENSLCNLSCHLGRT